jgi:hypothetical protein
LSANVGEGLFFAGQSHVAIQVIAAPFEHDMITSNPAEIEERKENEAKLNQEQIPQSPPAVPPTHPEIIPEIKT